MLEALATAAEKGDEPGLRDAASAFRCRLFWSQAQDLALAVGQGAERLAAGSRLERRSFHRGNRRRRRRGARRPPARRARVQQRSHLRHRHRRRQMTVHFIGAGPGAADLITVRGRDLIAALPGVPLCRLARAEGAARLLPARRAHRRYRADGARRNRRRVRGGDRSGPRCGAAAFGRSVDLERARRADATARCAWHPLHGDARRAVLCRRRRRACAAN